MRALRLLLRSLAHHRSAATAVEYAFVAALSGVAIAAATTSVGNELSGLMNDVARILLGWPPVEAPPP